MEGGECPHYNTSSYLSSTIIILITDTQTICTQNVLLHQQNCVNKPSVSHPHPDFNDCRTQNQQNFFPNYRHKIQKEKWPSYKCISFKYTRYSSSDYNMFSDHFIIRLFILLYHSPSYKTHISLSILLLKKKRKKN